MNASLAIPTTTTLHPRQVPPFAIAFALPFANFAPALVLTLQLSALVFFFELFQTILSQTLTVWAKMPPANQVVLEAGNMRIEFGCTMEPVPWEFVADFASSQIEAINRGFAPVFAREWWWEKWGKGGGGGEGGGEGGRTGRLCYVGIRMVGEGGVVVPPS